MNICANAPSILTIPLFGSMSDHYGRKPMLYLPFIGGMIHTSTILFVGRTNSSLWWLVGSRLFQGILGSTQLIVTLSYAFISDLTLEVERSVRFAYAESTIFLAFLIGPFLGIL